MKTRVNLKPGQKGTKRLVQQYGDTLICVRYRYDAKAHKQHKTVEIIVSESVQTPPPAKYPDGALVPLKIGINEMSLQNQVRAVGGRWNKQRQVWLVPYGCVAGTKLEKLIVVETLVDTKKDNSLQIQKPDGSVKCAVVYSGINLLGLQIYKLAYTSINLLIHI